jgi:hypothetical protein
MSIYTPRTIFGIHSMTAMSRTTGLPYGIIKVVASAENKRERESVDLFGGSNPNQWDAEFGNVTGDVTVNFKEFKPFLFQLAGYTLTSGGAEASGAVTAPINVTCTSGTGVLATGMTLAISTTTTNKTLRAGTYRAVATTTAAVTVYAVTDVDGQTYANDTLLITTAAISLTSSAAQIPGIGISVLTSGAIEIGDVAEFTIRSANSGNYLYTYGTNPTPIEFGMFLFSQKKANGEFVEDYFPRVKMGGLPTPLTEKAWSEASVTMKILTDTSAGYSHRRRDVVKTL